MMKSIVRKICIFVAMVSVLCITLMSVSAQEINFIGKIGSYVCTTPNEYGWTGNIEISSIENNTLYFSIKRIDTSYALLSGEAKMLDNTIAKYEDRGCVITFIWLDTNNIYVTYSGIIDSRDAPEIEIFTKNVNYELKETNSNISVADTKSAIPENPNSSNVVDEAIYGAIENQIETSYDSFFNNLMGWAIDIADSSVDKRNIAMYYGVWYDSSTGNYITISEGTEGSDYSIDLSSLGYDKVNGTFTASQTIYIGSMDLGILMNEDGSIYVEKISVANGSQVLGTYVKKYTDENEYVIDESSVVENYCIDIVKEAAFYDDNPEQSIGDVFENYFSNGQWSYLNLQEESNKDIEHGVVFSGECYLEGEMTNVEMWFVVEDIESGIFYMNKGFCSNENYTIDDIIMAAVQNVDVTESTSTNTWENYINSCQKVTLENIARNPDSYIGKNIIVYGSLGETMGVYSIGLWTSNYPMTVKYNDVAYDVNLNPLGNILDSDKGYVIGQMIDDSTIEAMIVIVSESDCLFTNDNNPFKNQVSELEGTDGVNKNEFIGTIGNYVCTTAEDDGFTGYLLIHDIGENTLSYELKTLDFSYSLISGEAKIIDSSTAEIIERGCMIKIEWSDSENLYVTYSGIIDSRDAGVIEAITDGELYYKAAQFNS